MENCDGGGGKQYQAIIEENKTKIKAKNHTIIISALNLLFILLLFLLLFLLLPFVLLFHFLLLLIIIIEGKAKASPREKCLGASKKSDFFLPFLQLHFLGAASSDESSIIFTFPMVVLGQIRLTKHLPKYSTF